MHSLIPYPHPLFYHPSMPYIPSTPSFFYHTPSISAAYIPPLTPSHCSPSPPPTLLTPLPPPPPSYSQVSSGELQQLQTRGSSDVTNLSISIHQKGLHPWPLSLSFYNPSTPSPSLLPSPPSPSLPTHHHLSDRLVYLCVSGVGG